MDDGRIPRFGSDSKIIFYQTRFEIHPSGGSSAEVWPQIMKSLQIWLEEKEGANEERGKPSLFEQLTGDVVNYTDLIPGLNESCYLSERLATGKIRLETSQSRLESKALFREERIVVPDYWAMEYIEQDSRLWYRRWYTNVGITALGNGSYAVNARISIADDPAFLISRPDIPPRNTPRFIRAMLVLPGCQAVAGDCRLPSHELRLNGTRFGAFASSLVSKNRTVPLVVVSAFRDDPTAFAIDPSRLAENLRGTAIVYVLDLSDPETRRAYQRCFAFGTPAYQYRIDSGFARVFFPGVNLNDEEGRRRHHFYTPEKLQGTRVGIIENDICGAISRFYRRRPDEALEPLNIVSIENRLKRRAAEAKFKQLEEEHARRASEAEAASDDGEPGRAAEDASLRIQRYEDDLAFYRQYIELIEQSQAQDEAEDRILSLEEEVSQLKDERNQLQAKADNLQYTVDALSRSKTREQMGFEAMELQAKTIQSLREFPKTPGDAARLAKRAFSDRLVMTDEAIDSAERYGSGSADETFDILRGLAMELWPLYFDEHSMNAGDVRTAFQNSTGYELTFNESSMTNKDTRLRQLRQLEYNGKTIDISPHVKGTSGKRTEPLRVHFYVDRESKRIVVGHCGAHMETAGTRRVK